MKMILRILFFFLLATQLFYAQWFWQNPLPQGNTLNDVCFVDENKGWAVGYAGTIIHTTNGGVNWEFQNINKIICLEAVEFINEYFGVTVGEDGIIFKTTNGGFTWNELSSGSVNWLNSISVIDEKNIFILSDNEILKSTDGGLTWNSQIFNNVPYLRDIDFIDANNGIAVGGGWNGVGNQICVILRTSNGGINWNISLSGSQYPIFYSAKFFDLSNVWVTGADGIILKSTNSGVNWTEQISGTSSRLGSITFKDLNNGIILGYDEQNNKCLIIRTTNGGTNWIQQSTDISDGLKRFSFISPNFVWGIGPGIDVYGCTIVYSTDFGFTWITQSSGISAALSSVQFIDINIGWAVGDSGTILHTTNAGGDWVQQASGTNIKLVDISFVDANTGWVLASEWDPNVESVLLKTTNGGIDWSQQIQDSLYFNAVCFIDENIGWLVSDSILKTTDGGNSWIPKPTIIYEHGISDVQFLDAFTGFAIGSSSTILKSTDGGDNWIIQMFHGYGVTWNRISFSDAENGCVVSTDNPFVNGGRITHTTNGGADWIYTQHPPGIFHDLCSINSNIVYVVGRKYINGYNIKGLILRSSDAITTWDEQLFEIDKAFNGVHFLDENIGWVVGDSGTILHTTNGGVTFIDNEPTQPKEFILEQNYPNPFNPSTTISWQSPVGSHQTIKVFDVLGNEITTLVDEYKPAGSYNVEFTINNLQLSSGIYFYQLKAGEYTAVKKMILIK